MPKPGRMLSPAMTREQRTAAELIYLCEEKSINYTRMAIARMFKIEPPSYRQLRTHLWLEGYLRDKSRAAIVSPNGKMSDDRLLLAMSELASGSTVASVAAKVGVNRSTIHRWRRMLGAREEEKR